MGSLILTSEIQGIRWTLTLTTPINPMNKLFPLLQLPQARLPILIFKESPTCLINLQYRPTYPSYNLTHFGCKELSKWINLPPPVSKYNTILHLKENLDEKDWNLKWKMKLKISPKTMEKPWSLSSCLILIGFNLSSELKEEKNLFQSSRKEKIVSMLLFTWKIYGPVVGMLKSSEYSAIYF